jgi:hypothetical protein
MIKLRYGVSVFFGEDWEYKMPSQVETTEMAHQAYLSMEKLEKGDIFLDVYQFLGYTFHLIQQTGGMLLHKESEVLVLDIKCTDGSPFEDSTLLMKDGYTVRLSDLLNKTC